jgi:hypothetical protein
MQMKDEFFPFFMVQVGCYESTSAYEEGFPLNTLRANPVKFQLMREPAKASLLHHPVL